MQKYIDQLIADIQKKIKTRKEGSIFKDIEFENEDNNVMFGQLLEGLDDFIKELLHPPTKPQASFFSQLGFEPVQFPPVDRLNDLQLIQLNEALFKLFFAFNLIIRENPSEYTPQMLYKLLIDQMHKQFFIPKPMFGYKSISLAPDISINNPASQKSPQYDHRRDLLDKKTEALGLDKLSDEEKDVFLNNSSFHKFVVDMDEFMDEEDKLFKNKEKEILNNEFSFIFHDYMNSIFEEDNGDNAILGMLNEVSDMLKGMQEDINNPMNEEEDDFSDDGDDDGDFDLPF